MKSRIFFNTRAAHPLIAFFTTLSLLLALMTPVQATQGGDPCAGAKSDMDQRQLNEYCAAAKAEKEAAKNNKILKGVWGAVAAVCATAAIMCMTPAIAAAGAWGMYCDFSNIGAGVVDAVMTKNFASMLTTMGSFGMSYMMKDGNLKADTAGAVKGEKTDATKNANKSCMSAGLTAASAAIQCFMKNAAADNANDAADRNLQVAQQLNSTANANLGTAGSAATGTQGTISQPSGTGVASNVNAADPCAVAQNSANPSAHISCALSMDSGLPRAIGHPDFQKDFERLTGKPLAQCLTQDDPVRAIGGAASGGLNAAGATKLASALDEMNKKAKSFYATEFSGGSYASGGGSGGSGGSGAGGDAPDFNAIMGGLMDQMNANAKEDKPPSITEVDFTQLKRNPAVVTEDKTISIFTRISYRYYYVSKRVVPARGPLK